jgi:hypothetical protein
MSCVAQEKLDATHKMVVLDALSTFVKEAEPAGRDYKNFRCQESLDEHCSKHPGCDVFPANTKVCISNFLLS